jgi:hypothetical protein
MLKYNQRRHSDGRFGIYFADRLLATIGHADEVRAMLYRLNQRFSPDAGQNDVQPTPRRRRRANKAPLENAGESGS